MNLYFQKKLDASRSSTSVLNFFMPYRFKPFCIIYPRSRSSHAIMHRPLLAMLFLLLLPTTPADVLLLDAVFLVNSVHFNASLYDQVLSDVCVCTPMLLSIQSETPTGAEVRKLYFPQHTEIRLFHLVHITRVQAVVTTDGRNLTAALQERCLNAGVPPMTVVRLSAQTDDQNLDLRALIARIPPVVAPVAIGVWLLTMLVCGTCWLYVCCCRRKSPQMVVAHVVEKPPVAPPQPTEVHPQTDSSSHEHDDVHNKQAPSAPAPAGPANHHQPAPSAPSPPRPAKATPAPQTPVHSNQPPAPPPPKPTPPQPKPPNQSTSTTNRQTPSSTPQQPIDHRPAPPPPSKSSTPIGQPSSKAPLVSTNTRKQSLKEEMTLPSRPIDLSALHSSTPASLLFMSPWMRLPPELEAADRHDRYGAQTCLRGPAAVRLESWPEAPGP